jgi:hypothetical protein
VDVGPTGGGRGEAWVASAAVRFLAAERASIEGTKRVCCASPKVAQHRSDWEVYVEAGVKRGPCSSGVARLESLRASRDDCTPRQKEG